MLYCFFIIIIVNIQCLLYTTYYSKYYIYFYSSNHCNNLVMFVLLSVNVLLKYEIYREKHTHPKCTARWVFAREARPGNCHQIKKQNITSPQKTLLPSYSHSSSNPKGNHCPGCQYDLILCGWGNRHGEVQRFARSSTVVTGRVGIQRVAVWLQDCVHTFETTRKRTIGW